MERKGYLYLALAAGVIVVLGKLTWEAWFSYVVPTAGRIGELSPASLLVFASLAGFASFFAPCAFPLLPGYISYYLGMVEAEGRTRPPVYLGAIGGLGIVVFFSVIGGGLTALGTPFTPYLTRLKPLIALGILLLGVAMIRNYTLSSTLLDRLKLGIARRSRETRSPSLGIFLFGLAYAAASLGCTLPVFGALLLYTLSLGSGTGVLVFLAYAASMGGAMLTATVVISRTGGTLTRRLAASTAMIKKGSGAVLVLVGLYLLSFYVRFGM
jgi:cytochrome c-type biogenesis protein